LTAYKPNFEEGFADSKKKKPKARVQTRYAV